MHSESTGRAGWQPVSRADLPGDSPLRTSLRAGSDRQTAKYPQIIHGKPSSILKMPLLVQHK
ncbi:unnamed protein product, partial [Pleuronectes platessa]